MVNLCALLVNGGQHLFFLVRVLDGDYYHSFFFSRWGDSRYEGIDISISIYHTAISKGVSIFLASSKSETRIHSLVNNIYWSSISNDNQVQY